MGCTATDFGDGYRRGRDILGRYFVSVSMHTSLLPIEKHTMLASDGCESSEISRKG